MATIQQLLRIIPYGKQNAIHAEDIARQLHLPTNGNQVETRKLIREAIAQGHFIVSTKSGYWQSNDIQEVREYIASLRRRAQNVINRSDDIRNMWNNANPNNQI